MIKYYCDRCKRQIKGYWAHEITIFKSRDEPPVNTEDFCGAFCHKCYKKLYLMLCDFFDCDLKEISRKDKG